MTKEHLRLSVGAPPGQRAVSVLVGGFFTIVGLVFVALPLVADGLLRRLTGPGGGLTSYEDARDIPPELLPPELRDGGTGGGPGLGAGRFLGLCGLPIALLGLYLVLRVLRTAAWLDGTRARVRGAFGSHTVDLATAEVGAGMVSYRDTGDDRPGSVQRVPTIVARDAGTGRRVTIPLRGMGLATLPPYELRALADAMTAGRPTSGRDGDAHALAGQLRAMAERPLGV
ncbi:MULTISPECIES: hypothetical protein [Micromonospora]|uniref:hypothetical protein n=1 Tax=Micromonospora TaxID=1873 RepID=UPI00114D947C|nr:MULTISPECIES: hypothetical protein [unclassified Micromonospora]MBQ0976647.1 hypothetical protein [Micromonospora sp. M61]TQJ20522.1 hypothetical protein FBZ33_0720 [Micromonospora sp. A202]WTI19421.1 hypothetical protein OG886_20825 [Micromonospora zamorensis]